LCAVTVILSGFSFLREIAVDIITESFCNTLDYLLLAEHGLLRGYENPALSLLRRAYETVSLMAYFNFPEKVRVWEEGRAIRQPGIRVALKSAPYPEPKETLDEMYRVYSLKSAHAGLSG